MRNKPVHLSMLFAMMLALVSGGPLGCSSSSAEEAQAEAGVDATTEATADVAFDAPADTAIDAADKDAIDASDLPEAGEIAVCGDGYQAPPMFPLTGHTTVITVVAPNDYGVDAALPDFLLSGPSNVRAPYLDGCRFQALPGHYDVKVHSGGADLAQAEIDLPDGQTVLLAAYGGPGDPGFQVIPVDLSPTSSADSWRVQMTHLARSNVGESLSAWSYLAGTTVPEGNPQLLVDSLEYTKTFTYVGPRPWFLEYRPTGQTAVGGSLADRLPPCQASSGVFAIVIWCDSADPSDPARGPCQWRNGGFGLYQALVGDCS